MSAIDIYESYSGRIEEIIASLKRNIQEIGLQSKHHPHYHSPYKSSKWETKMIKLRAHYHYHRGGFKMYLGEKLFIHDLFIDGEQERILGLLNLEENHKPRHREVTLEDVLAEKIIVDRPMYRSTVKPKQ